MFPDVKKILMRKPFKTGIIPAHPINFKLADAKLIKMLGVNARSSCNLR